MSIGEQPLPRGWENPALAEIAQVNPALDRCVLHDGIEVNFVPMRAVEAEGGGLVRPEVKAYGEVKKGYTVFLSNDVIMAKITPCMENGKTTVVPELPGQVCYGSTEFHVVRPERGIQSRWLAQFLLQHEVRRAAQRRMTGGVGQMRVPASFLETVRVPLAPAAEQERIADDLDELLSDLDAGVAALERVRAKLKLYRASVLKAAVEGALTSDWRARHPHAEPASELLKRILIERRRYWEEEQLLKFKEKGQAPPKNWKEKYKEPNDPDTKNLLALPDGWCWATVEQLTSELMNGYGKRSQVGGQPQIVLRLADITSGEISYADVRKINCTDGETRKYALTINDILILRVNGSPDLVGRFVLVRKMTEKALYCDHFIRARCSTPNLPVWLRAYSDSARFRRYIDLNKVSSAGQNTINQGSLLQFEIPLPPSSEQEVIMEAIEDQFSVIDHLETNLDAKLKSSQSLRQALLRYAFTGQLVPQDPNDEPASELLKSIAADREILACVSAAVKKAKKKTTPSKTGRRGRSKKIILKDNA